MSYVEINFIKKSKVNSGAEVHNSHRGAKMVWNYFKSKFDTDKGKSFFDDNAFDETWGLFRTDRLSRAEKIVLGSTFDWVVVRRSEVEELCKAFEDLNIGNLSIQAKEIREAFKNDKKLNFVTWNQTSVCENQWLGYSLTKGKKHWFLFDDLSSPEE